MSPTNFHPKHAGVVTDFDSITFHDLEEPPIDGNDTILINYTDADDGRLPYLQCLFGATIVQPYLCLLDTGCSQSFISWDVLVTIPNHLTYIRSHPPTRVENADGRRVKANDAVMAYLPLTIMDKNSQRHTIIKRFLSTSLIENAIFLGQEFVLNKTSFSYVNHDFLKLLDNASRKKKYIIPIEWQTTKSISNLLTIKDMTIPPNTLMMVETIAERHSPFDDVLLISDRHTHSDKDGNVYAKYMRSLQQLLKTMNTKY